MKKCNEDLDRFVEPFREHRIELPVGYTVHHGNHGGPFTTEREDQYCGKRIVVRTTYEITVDGRHLDAHMLVMDDGSVHYHGLPNYSFRSAMEMVRYAIDSELKDPPEDQLNEVNREPVREGVHHGHS